MDLFYGRAGAIERAETGWLDGDAGVIALVQPRLQAPGGVGKSAALGPLWCVVRHDGACRLTLTPVVDGVLRSDLTATFDFAAVASVRDESVRLILSDPVTWPGTTTVFSRQAVRGTWISVRATLQPLPGDLDPPTGTLFGLGGFQAEFRPLSTTSVDIPISGGG